MDDLDLSQVTSLGQLYEIREYWIQKQTEVQARTEQIKADVIREIEAIRCNTLNMEASLDHTNRSTTLTVRQPSCHVNQITERLEDSPIEQLNPDARVYQSSDETRATSSSKTPIPTQEVAICDTPKEKTIFKLRLTSSKRLTPTDVGALGSQLARGLKRYLNSHQ